MADTGVRNVEEEELVSPVASPGGSFQFPLSPEVWLPDKDIKEITGNQEPELSPGVPASSRTVSQLLLWSPLPT